MNDNKKKIVWVIRLVVAILFILSAAAKLYPSPHLGISTFEAKYLGGIGIEGQLAKVMSRLLIGFEFTLAVLILLPYYLKKLVIPATIGLLGAFSVHLLIQTIGGDASNCGCFGELIPMTPLQALIKNILTIGLLLLPLTIFKDAVSDDKNFTPILQIGLIISLLMFVLLPQGSMISEAESGEDLVNEDVSGYAKYFDDINEENKLLCFFSPTCEHCQATGKKLTEMKQKYPGLIPEIRILFMDEAGDGSAKDIEEYFKIAGANYSYKVLSIEEFVPIFWNTRNFPGVLYMYNGQERLFFDGTEENEFNADKLLEEIKKEY